MKQLCNGNNMCLFITKFFSLRKKLSAWSSMGIWTTIADILEF